MIATQDGIQKTLVIHRQTTNRSLHALQNKLYYQNVVTAQSLQQLGYGLDDRGTGFRFKKPIRFHCGFIWRTDYTYQSYIVNENQPVPNDIYCRPPITNIIEIYYSLILAYIVYCEQLTLVSGETRLSTATNSFQVWHSQFIRKLGLLSTTSTRWQSRLVTTIIIGFVLLHSDNILF